ncbi:MAG: cytochrome C biogenesis protein [Acidobacteria bacterium]|jgi:heme exporter protein CcmB|nr:cytochrome C biogenesis protein [Acidobacteriota bacterium]MDP7339506.1 heme exporter protein CcmB [Vicinamibacterales bacterium]MDP7480519.1 heme exporter protein CcmB [Vicinamibacterales bacterium]MDP7692536.1 heme exporter protein CcmB [Vicinamibacterales bacterium]HJN46013.1 heme exporter protein CcmB [Vicinamibacterales bacterium]|tara:strand:- start:1873 stop:2556 length:684 start_codon:yes stop_codon:yes gene_type:complete
MSEFFRVAWLVMRKDLRVESRSREMLFTTLFFAVSCVLVFSFSFVRGGQAVEGAAPGILWIAIAFAGTLALGRAFERERQHDALRGLMLAPVDRPAIYLGKLIGLLLLLAAVEAVVVVMVAFLFQAPLFRHAWLLLALLVLGTIGFASVGTLFSAMLVRTTSRAVLLPILLYPVTIPVLIMGVSGTAALVQPEPDLAMARLWITLLIFFDAVFLVLALWTFEPVMTE